MKKTSLVLASLMLAGACFTACGSDDVFSSVEKLDEQRTQLYVANFDGGVGNAWLEKLKVSFEEAYAEVPFEPGKKGAQLIIDSSKANHLTAIATDSYNVIFAEGVSYNELAASNLLLDISDIVQEVNTDGKTIESKLTEHQKKSLTAVDGNYYVLPHYEYYAGVTYDRALFNRKSLYIKQGGGYTNATGNRSAGPDGKTGTKDDGLPATYEEFYALCNYMATKANTAPFIYTGGYPGYVDFLLEGLMTAYHGRDEMELAFTFDSTKGGTLSGDDVIKTDVITGFNGDTPIVEKKAISMTTGYETTQMAGRYYALDFVEKIVENKDKWLSDKMNSSLSHLDAQEEYIMSDLENEPIAMLIEGSFWYNEAKDAFVRSVDAYGADAEVRDFAWMPLPSKVSGKVTEANGSEQFLLDESYSYAVINANIKNDENLVNLAKTFLKFAYTDENLREFTVTSGCFKGVQYEITEEQYNGMDSYYQSLVDLRGDGSNVVRPISDNKIYVNSENSFRFMHCSSFCSIVGGKAYDVAVTALKNGITAKDFFLGLKTTQGDWNTLYSKWFN